MLSANVLHMVKFAVNAIEKNHYENVCKTKTKFSVKFFKNVGMSILNWRNTPTECMNTVMCKDCSRDALKLSCPLCLICFLLKLKRKKSNQISE